MALVSEIKQMTTRKIPEDKKAPTNRYGDEAPSLKLFLTIMGVAVVLMVLAKVAYILFHI